MAGTDYPTLLAIGLGPQLAELERVCALSARGKHAGESIYEPGKRHHEAKALNHLSRGRKHDLDTGARHYILAAARLLMAAACCDREDPQ